MVVVPKTAAIQRDGKAFRAEHLADAPKNAENIGSCLLVGAFANIDAVVAKSALIEPKAT